MVSPPQFLEQIDEITVLMEEYLALRLCQSMSSSSRKKRVHAESFVPFHFFGLTQPISCPGVEFEKVPPVFIFQFQ
jgi:hypothetical protein